MCPSAAWDQYHAQEEEAQVLAWTNRVLDTPLSDLAQLYTDEMGADAGSDTGLIIAKVCQFLRGAGFSAAAERVEKEVESHE